MVYLIILGGVLAYAALQNGAVDRADWLYCSIIIGLLTVFYYSLTRKRDLAPGLEPWLYWPLILFPVYIAIQMASTSIVPSATMAHLLRILGYAATFLIVREIAWRRILSPWTLALPVLIVAALEAAWGLLLFFQGVEAQDSAHGTYENRNHFAGLLEMALPLSIMCAVSVYRKGRSTASSLKTCSILAVATLILVAIIYSFSRMGFVACLVSLFILGILALKNRVTKRWLAGGLVLCLALLAFIYLPPDQLIERFGKLWDGEELTTEGRLYIWEESLPLLKAYPLFGVGLGGFESAFYRYQKSVPSRRVDFAHNDYLQYLAELGLIGYLIAAALIGRVFITACRNRKMDEDSEEHTLATACIAALAAILIHSFVDFNLYVPANAMTMAWISGITAGVGFHARNRGHQWIDVRI
jgi:O-antigen ligase